MNVKEFSVATFLRHAKYIYKEMDTYFNEQEGVTKDCVNKAYANIGKEIDEDEKLNCDIIFDGTWITRGHRSHIGAALVMDM